MRRVVKWTAAAFLAALAVLAFASVVAWRSLTPAKMRPEFSRTAMSDVKGMQGPSPRAASKERTMLRTRMLWARFAPAIISDFMSLTTTPSCSS